MKSEYLAEFDQVAFGVDHLEASTINNQFDTIKGAVGPHMPLTNDQILDKAMMFTREADGYRPNHNGIDYDTYMSALRWADYRYAYLRDIEPVYQDLDDHSEFEWNQDNLEPEYESFAEKHEFLMDGQMRGRELVDSADPATCATFAALDRERVRRQRGDEFLLDPLELEREYTLNVLLNTLDAMVEGPESTPQDKSYSELRSVQTTTIADDTYYEDVQVECTIVRNKLDFESIYTVSIFKPIGTDETSTPEVYVEYHINESEDGTTIEASTEHGEVVIEAYTPLEVASSVSRDQIFSTERAAFKAVTPPRWMAAAARIINRLGDTAENFLQTVRPMYVGKDQGPTKSETPQEDASDFPKFKDF